MKAKVLFASTDNADMRYKVKASIPDAFLYFSFSGKEYIVLDKREFDAYLDCSTRSMNIEVLALEDFASNGSLDLCLKVFEKFQIDEIEVSDQFSLKLFQALQEKGIRISIAPVFLPQRWVKSEEEIGWIEASIWATEEALEFVKTVLKESRIVHDTLEYKGEVLTSEKLKKKVELLLLEKDMEATHGLILSCGRHAAMPHHAGSGPIRPNQLIICDFYPRSKITGYFADITRTFVKGIPTVQMEKMYDAVLDAQQAAFDMLRPGVVGQDVHEKVSESILKSGFDVGLEGFTHGTGHSFGMEIHESPTLSKRGTVAMEPGFIETVEPGLYYLDTGGVRLEDDVVITEGGYRMLTSFPKEGWIL